MIFGGWMLFGKRKRIVNRILIVEDEPLTAFDNEMMIGDLGYEVVATLDSFEDAIELLDREKIDLILSDYRLSGQRTGMDLAPCRKEPESADNLFDGASIASGVGATGGRVHRQAV